MAYDYYGRSDRNFESDIWFYLVAILLGSALTLSFAPFNNWLGLVVGFSGLLYYLELLQNFKYQISLPVNNRSNHRNFFLGYCFGFGHFISSLSWVHNSLTASPEIGELYGWMKPIVIILMPGIMAIFTGFATLTVNILSTKKQGSIIAYRIHLSILFIISWWIWEWVMSYLVIPFPWMVLGYASQYSLILMQGAHLYGVHGLSFVLLVLAIVVYVRSYSYTVVAALVLCSVAGYGQLRLASCSSLDIEFIQDENKTNQTENLLTKLDIDSKNHKKYLLITIVQPNIQLFTHGNYTNQLNNQILKTIQLSVGGLSNNKSIQNLPLSMVIWPESGIRSIINNQNDLQFLRGLIPKNSVLLTGADTYDGSGYYNSMLAINDESKIIWQYDKRILAPFGEYIPGANLLSWIQPLVVNIGFSHGTKEQVINIASQEINNDACKDYKRPAVHQSVDTTKIKNDYNIKILPFICYEIAFPFMAKPQKYDIIIQITNDVWFGDSIGPYQHLAMARMRAIEYNKPLLRVANTGISAVIDGNGRMLSFLQLNKTGVITAILGL